MAKHMYIHSENAEEALQEALIEIKNKTAWESRKKAFEDCTQYWKETTEHILSSDSSDSEKLDRISKMF
jgi:predicted nucleic acid-binding protein